MIAKLVAHSSSRQLALRAITSALEKTQIVGPETNIEFLKKVATNPDFVAGDVETGLIKKYEDTIFKTGDITHQDVVVAALAYLGQGEGGDIWGSGAREFNTVMERRVIFKEGFDVVVRGSGVVSVEVGLYCNSRL